MSLMAHSRSIPAIRTTLLREVCPRTMFTSDLDTFSLRYVQPFCEELDDGVIRFALIRRRGYSDSDCPVAANFDGVAAGLGLNVDV